MSKRRSADEVLADAIREADRLLDRAIDPTWSLDTTMIKNVENVLETLDRTGDAYARKFEDIALSNSVGVKGGWDGSSLGDRMFLGVRAVVRTAPICFHIDATSASEFFKALTDALGEVPDRKKLLACQEKVDRRIRELDSELKDLTGRSCSALSPKDTYAHDCTREYAARHAYDAISSLMQALANYGVEDSAEQSVYLKPVFTKAADSLYAGIWMDYDPNDLRDVVIDSFRVSSALLADLVYQGGFNNQIITVLHETPDLWYSDPPTFWHSWYWHYPEQVWHAQQVLEKITPEMPDLKTAQLPSRQTSGRVAINAVKRIFREFEPRRKQIAHELQSQIRCLGVVAPATVAEGQQLAQAISNLLRQCGCTLVFSGTHEPASMVYLGTQPEGRFYLMGTKEGRRTTEALFGVQSGERALRDDFSSVEVMPAQARRPRSKKK